MIAETENSEQPVTTLRHTKRLKPSINGVGRRVWLEVPAALNPADISRACTATPPDGRYDRPCTEVYFMSGGEPWFILASEKELLNAS